MPQSLDEYTKETLERAIARGYFFINYTHRNIAEDMLAYGGFTNAPFDPTIEEVIAALDRLYPHKLTEGGL